MTSTRSRSASPSATTPVRWFVRPSHHRVTAAALMTILACLLVIGPTGSGAGASSEVTDSTVTVTGRTGQYDDFSDLEITVSKTSNLTNEGITISWTGGTASQEGNTPGVVAGSDYLQIMQCWGDPAADNFRETCQYGYSSTILDTSSRLGGLYTDSRDLMTSYDDPAETLAADAMTVPFQPVSGDRTPDGSASDPMPDNPLNPKSKLSPYQTLADYYSPYSTNELPYAITGADGTGRVTFEVQTVTEAAGLGCGSAVTVADGSTAARSCSLVIVPRGEHQVDGTAVTSGVSLVGSPLSASNWANRIVVPLEFELVTEACATGTTEVSTAGSELVEEAISSWTPALCADSGPVFKYSQVSEVQAANLLANEQAGEGLVFTTDGVASSETTEMVNAPVAISGAVVAFNIDIRLDSTLKPTDEVAELSGTQLTELNLTPRLMAKILTQSYLSDIPGGNQGVLDDDMDYLLSNPRSLRNDPEFLEYNPIFHYFNKISAQPDGILVSYTNSSAAREVWRWILADDEARVWLAGLPDEYGMVVNSAYTYLASEEASDSFPKAETWCYLSAEYAALLPEGHPGICTQDKSPYLNTMHQAAYNTLRADSQQTVLVDATATEPRSLKRGLPTAVGRRWTMSITDAASAARYGLSTANLASEFG